MVLAGDNLAYYKRCWLDDIGSDPCERLRDCALSVAGIETALEAAKDVFVPPEGPLLLVVSPLLRTVLTTCLLFHRVAGRVRARVEASCAETINAPHDLVENIGRAPEDVFAEAYAILSGLEHCPDGALLLLARLHASSRGLSPNWWFRRPEQGQLPGRVLESGAARRAGAIQSAVEAHVASAFRGRSPPSAVFVVCHWGVVFTLAGERGARNLEMVPLPAFWEQTPLPEDSSAPFGEACGGADAPWSTPTKAKRKLFDARPPEPSPAPNTPAFGSPLAPGTPFSRVD